MQTRLDINFRQSRTIHTCAAGEHLLIVQLDFILTRFSTASGLDFDLVPDSEQREFPYALLTRYLPPTTFGYTGRTARIGSSIPSDPEVLLLQIISIHAMTVIMDLNDLIAGCRTNDLNRGMLRVGIVSIRHELSNCVRKSRVHLRAEVLDSVRIESQFKRLFRHPC